MLTRSVFYTEMGAARRLQIAALGCTEMDGLIGAAASHPPVQSGDTYSRPAPLRRFLILP